MNKLQKVLIECCKEIKQNNMKSFKPFEKVLVKDIDGYWNCDFYSHWSKENNCHQLVSLHTCTDDRIISYTGNEHLVGTISAEQIKFDEGTVIIGFDEDPDDFDDCFDDMFFCTDAIKSIEDSLICGNNDKYNCCIPFDKFNVNDREETRKWILVAKGNKLIKANN